MTRDRLKERFAVIKGEERSGLIVFLTAGFPDLTVTRELVPALVAAGADAVELGVPFSDPIGEGPTIQESTFRALEQGVTLQDCLDLVADLRERVPETPLILMSYYNPIYSYGLVRFANTSQRVGVDGLVVVDLPHAEVVPLADVCAPLGIHIIPLLAPTSTDASIKASVSNAGGFVYCIGLTGVTGAREQLSQRSFDLLRRVRPHTQLPLAVGFGISRRDHVEEVCRQAEAAVVGSALIRVMLESPRDQLIASASALVAELAGMPFPVKGGTA